MSCDNSSLFRCVTRIQAINFFRKVKYNLLNETIWRIFLVICFIYICLAYSGYTPGVWWQCLCAIIMLISFCTFILKLMKAKRLLTLAKHSSIVEEHLTSFGALIAGLPRARSARGTEPHTHGIWSTSFLLVVTWLTERTYVRTRLQIVRVG